MAWTESVTRNSRQSLEENIQLLSSLAAAESPILSCYLDLDPGSESAIESLDELAVKMRSEMNAMDRLDFDEAYTQVKASVSEQQEPDVRGLAIFARGIMGGRFLSVIPSILPFRQQLTYYPVPDIRPLLSLRDAYGDHLLLWADAEGVEVLRLSNGCEQTLAWLAGKKLKGLAHEGGRRSAREKKHIGGFATRSLARVLTTAQGLKLILAGDSRALSRLWHWLPRPFRSQVSDTVTVPGSLTRAKALRQIIDHTAVGCRAAVDAFAKACLQAPFVDRQCVTGPHETLAAMRSGALKTLFISSEGMPSLPTGSTVSSLESKRMVAESNQGIYQSQDWHLGIELSRLASQQGLLTLVTDTRELILNGGVGGILHDSIESVVMQPPETLFESRMVA